MASASKAWWWVVFGAWVLTLIFWPSDSRAKPWVMAGIFCAAIVVCWRGITFVRPGARKRAWQSFAGSMGLKFDPSHSSEMARDPRYPLFRSGQGRWVHNVATGYYRNRSVHCFDFGYRTGGRDARVVCYSVVRVATPVAFGQIYIRPESLGDRLAQAVGLDDIDFESYEFSQRYYVKAADKRFAYDVLHQRAMEFLLRHPDIVIEGNPEAILVHYPRPGLVGLPHGMKTLLDLACDFLELTPGYVVEDRRG